MRREHLIRTYMESSPGRGRSGFLYKSLFTTAFVGLVSTLALAHEFWMQPNKFFFRPGEKLVVNLKVGENFLGEPWDLSKHKVVQLRHYTPAGMARVESQVRNIEGKNLELTLNGEGTHQLVLESNAAFIELDAVKFREYLVSDGLEDILQLREKKGMADQPAREFYTRYSKLLVQVGDVPDPSVTSPAGLKIELVPLRNPYGLAPGEQLTCRLLYERKALPHTMVKVWNVKDNRAFLQNLYTENDGTVTFPIGNSGRWMVSAVKMVPSAGEGADYESMWASLVFGVK